MHPQHNAPANHIELAIVRAVSAVAGLSPLDRQKPILIIEEIRSSDWASATFIGKLLAFDLRIEGEAAAVAAAMTALESGLADRDIAIGGQIVAEIGVLPGDGCATADNMLSKSLTVNALTIND